MKNDMHTCSYYCTRPACINNQRDELRDRLMKEQVNILLDTNGDALIPIPQHMLDELGWKEGDRLSIVPTAFALKKITDE